MEAMLARASSEDVGKLRLYSMDDSIMKLVVWIQIPSWLNVKNEKNCQAPTYFCKQAKIIMICCLHVWVCCMYDGAVIHTKCGSKPTKECKQPQETNFLNTIYCWMYPSNAFEEEVLTNKLKCEVGV